MSARVPASSYGFDTMQVGDSYLVRVERGTAKANRRIAILTAARKAGVVVSTRSDAEGLIVERRA